MFSKFFPHSKKGLSWDVLEETSYSKEVQDFGTTDAPVGNKAFVGNKALPTRYGKGGGNLLRCDPALERGRMEAHHARA